MLASPGHSEGVEVQEDHHEVVTGRDDSEGVEVQEDYHEVVTGRDDYEGWKCKRTSFRIDVDQFLAPW